jgi:hypothetical protein
MKLGPEHIGKKVVYQNQLGYLLVKKFECNEGGDVLVYGETTEEHKSRGVIEGKAYYSWDNNHWTFYNDTSLFDSIFKKFGCNEQYVKELVTAIFKEFGKELPK